MTNDWQDHLAGARMRVDQEFEQQVTDSPFSNQEWGLIMTAVEFDIQSPENPEEAVLVADTEKLEAVGPELDRIRQERTGAPGGPGGGDSGGSGLFDRLSDALGSLAGSSGGGVDEEQLAEARVLADEYAKSLQAHLEKHGRWAEVCTMAAESDG